MATGIWTAKIQAWMDEIDALSIWWGLFSASPFGADPLTVEVIGGGYVRINGPHDRPAFNIIRNTAALTWLNLPAGVHLWGVGAWDADINGNLQAALPLLDPTSGDPTPVDLPAGGTWSLNPFEAQFGVDAVLGP